MLDMQRIIARFKSKTWLLLPIMALAFYMAYIPHQAGHLPVHLDEWTHIANANEIISHGSMRGLVDPFTGGPLNFNQTVESGFETFLAVFHQVSGLSWPDITRFFPGVLFMGTVLSVYTLTRKYGTGVESAFFTTLIITTVGLLGPGFLVPVAMGLFFVPLVLYIVLNHQTVTSYLALSVITVFLVAMHSVTALIVGLILIPYVILGVKSKFSHSLGVTASIGLPIILAIIFFPDVFQEMTLALVSQLLVPQDISPYVQVPFIVSAYGYFPVALGALGMGVLTFRGGLKNYSLVLGLMLLVVVLVVYFRGHYGDAFVYYRGLMYAMLMTGIVAGAGLNSIRTNDLTRWLAARAGNRFWARHAGNAAALGIAAAILVIAIPAHQNTPYYHMIDETDYQTFTWIRNNVDASYDRAVLDPWKGAAFVAITGKHVYAYTTVRLWGTGREAYSFLDGSCTDSDFLRTKHISLVYTRGECLNPDLVEIHKYVYVFHDPEAPPAPTASSGTAGNSA